ncbi:MAG: hypothetical protein ABIN79_03430 [Marmoricola sp.]
MSFPRRVTVLATCILALGVSGCQLITEHMCSDGEYPTYALDNPDGAYCEKDGRQPEPGFAAYPEKRVPQVVGDKYDRWPLAEDYPWRDEVDPALRK